MGKALRFRQSNVARQPSELARVRIIKGPDTGSVFVISSTKAIIGRGEDTDVILTDLKTSRHHVEIVLDGNQWILRDLGSVNGALCNGINTRKTILTGKDVVTVGETTFEFLSSVQSSTRSLVIPFPKSENTRQSQNTQTYDSMTGGGTFGVSGMGVGTAIPLPPDQQKKSSPLVLLLMIAGVLAFIMMSGEEQKDSVKGKLDDKKKQKISAAERSDLEAIYTQGLSATPPAATPEAKQALRSADQFYRAGFREYREGNFVRARTQFENALQIYPGHALAIIYLQNCQKRTEEQIKTLLETGKKNLDSGRLKSSKGQFESILRILARDQINPAFIEAKEQLERVRRELSSDAQVESGDVKR